MLMPVGGANHEDARILEFVSQPAREKQDGHMNPDETGGGKQSEATADKGD